MIDLAGVWARERHERHKSWITVSRAFTVCVDAAAISLTRSLLPCRENADEFQGQVLRIQSGLQRKFTRTDRGRQL